MPDWLASSTAELTRGRRWLPWLIGCDHVTPSAARWFSVALVSSCSSSAASFDLLGTEMHRMRARQQNATARTQSGSLVPLLCTRTTNTEAITDTVDRTIVTITKSPAEKPPHARITITAHSFQRQRLRQRHIILHTCIAAQAAYRSCSGAVHVTYSGRTAYRPWAKLAPTNWPKTNQPYATLVCRLMVSTPVIHVTTRLPTPKGWKAEFAWLVGWLIADTLPTKWSHVNYRSGIDQGKSASQRPTS